MDRLTDLEKIESALETMTEDEINRLLVKIPEIDEEVGQLQGKSAKVTTILRHCGLKPETAEEVKKQLGVVEEISKTTTLKSNFELDIIDTKVGKCRYTDKSNRNEPFSLYWTFTLTVTNQSVSERTARKISFAQKDNNSLKINFAQEDENPPKFAKNVEIPCILANKSETIEFKLLYPEKIHLYKEADAILDSSPKEFDDVILTVSYYIDINHDAISRDFIISERKFVPKK